MTAILTRFKAQESTKTQKHTGVYKHNDGHIRPDRGEICMVKDFKVADFSHGPPSVPSNTLWAIMSCTYSN